MTTTSRAYDDPYDPDDYTAVPLPGEAPQPSPRQQRLVYVAAGAALGVLAAVTLVITNWP